MDKFAGSKRYAAQIAEEAGATRLFAARCVTSVAGSLPPHQFSGCTNGVSYLPRRSAFLLAFLRAGMVTGARVTLVTVAVTNAVTSDVCKTTHGTEVMDRIGRGENNGMGWSDPTSLPPNAWRSLQPNDQSPVQGAWQSHATTYQIE